MPPKKAAAKKAKNAVDEGPEGVLQAVVRCSYPVSKRLLLITMLDYRRLVRQSVSTVHIGETKSKNPLSALQGLGTD